MVALGGLPAASSLGSLADDLPHETPVAFICRQRDRAVQHAVVVKEYRLPAPPRVLVHGIGAEARRAARPQVLIKLKIRIW